MYRNLDPDLLRTFIAVCETGKFNAAARRIGKTQAAVSMQIKRLESLLGRNLFERDNRNVHLSVPGEMLYEYAQKLIRLNDEACLSITNTETTAVLRLGAPEVLISTHLPKILSLFRQDYPDVALDVTCGLTEDLLREFNQNPNKYDVIVFLQDRSRSLRSNRVVFQEQLVWLRGKNGAAFDTKAPLPLILSPYPCVYRRLAIESLEKAGIEWRAVLTAHSLSGRIAAVKRGLGVSLMPHDIIDPDLIPFSPTPTASAKRGLALAGLDLAVLTGASKNKKLAENLIDGLEAYFRGRGA